MKFDLSKVSYDGRWFDFGNSKLKIRPYPASLTDVIFKNGAMILSGTAGKDMFDYCLEAWESVTDAEDKALKLTSSAKGKIYDFRLGTELTDIGAGECMSDFVRRTARLLTAEIEADTKN